MFVSSPYPRPPYEAGPLWPGSRPATFEGTAPAAQLQVLLARSSRLWLLPWRTFGQEWAYQIKEMIGVLGGLTIALPQAVYGIWLAAMAAGAAADSAANRGDPRTPSLLDAALLAAAAAACIWLIYLSQYLLWTNVGNSRIEGMQGRYLTPLLPMMALAVPRFRIPAGNVVRLVLGMVPSCAAAADLILVPPVVVAWWYIG